jgi:hypothetical protein
MCLVAGFRKARDRCATEKNSKHCNIDYPARLAATIPAAVYVTPTTLAFHTPILGSGSVVDIAVRTAPGTPKMIDSRTNTTFQDFLLHFRFWALVLAVVGPQNPE